MYNDASYKPGITVQNGGVRGVFPTNNANTFNNTTDILKNFLYTDPTLSAGTPNNNIPAN
jgi:hypothetical protein